MDKYNTGINALETFKPGNIITALVDDNHTRIKSIITGVVLDYSILTNKNIHITILLKDNIVTSFYALCIEDHYKYYIRNQVECPIHINHSFIDLDKALTVDYNPIISGLTDDYPVVSKTCTKTVIDGDGYYFGTIPEKIEQCSRAMYYLNKEDIEQLG